MLGKREEDKKEKEKTPETQGSYYDIIFIT